MRELLRSTAAYRFLRTLRGDGAVLVVFPDETYLRPLLKECAKAFFGEDVRAAQLIEREEYSDCLFYPAEDGKLSVEDGAKITEESLLRPVEGERKLFVLDRFHTATALVQNKLLKILEEPPRGATFLLGATAEYSVLPTVLSRVGKIAVAPFSEEAIERALVRNYGAAGAKEAAAASGGIYSVAEALLKGGGEEFRLAEEFLSGDASKLCRELDGKTQKSAFFSAVKLVLRDMLFYRTGQEQYAVRGGAEVRSLAERYEAGAILASLSLTAEAERQISFNAGFSACAEALAIGIEEEREKWQKLS